MTVMYEDYGYLCCVLLDKICKSCHRGFIQKNPSLSVKNPLQIRVKQSRKGKKKNVCKKSVDIFSQNEYYYLNGTWECSHYWIRYCSAGKTRGKKCVDYPKFLGLYTFLLWSSFFAPLFLTVKKRTGSKVRSSHWSAKEGRSKRNELPARFDDSLQHFLEQSITSSLNGTSEKEKNTRPSA